MVLYAPYLFLFLFLSINYVKSIVGPHFSSQAQDAWYLWPASSIQWICREWAKKLGFSVWTTTIMAFLMGQAFQIELVLGWIRGAFPCASGVLGIHPPICFSLLPFYSRFSPLDWGSQGRYLSQPPLPPVVGSSYKDREVWLY